MRTFWTLKKATCHDHRQPPFLLPGPGKVDCACSEFTRKHPTVASSYLFHTTHRVETAGALHAVPLYIIRIQHAMNSCPNLGETGLSQPDSKEIHSETACIVYTFGSAYSKNSNPIIQNHYAWHIIAINTHKTHQPPPIKPINQH